MGWPTRKLAAALAFALLASGAPAAALAADPGALPAGHSDPDPLGGHEFTAAVAWSRVFFRTFPDEVSIPLNNVGSTVYQANDGGHPALLLQYLSPAWKFLTFDDAESHASAGLSLLGAAASFRADSTFSSQGAISGDYLLVTPFLFFRGGPLFSSTSGIYFRGGWGYGAATLQAQADYFSEVNLRRQHYRRTGSEWTPATVFLWELHWRHWVLSRRNTTISLAAGRNRFIYDEFSVALGYQWNL